jgi:hypothetical protein
MHVTIARRCRGWGLGGAGAAAGSEAGAGSAASPAGGSMRRVGPNGSQLDDTG